MRIYKALTMNLKLWSVDIGKKVSRNEHDAVSYIPKVGRNNEST